MKALKALIKPIEAPKRIVKTKINFSKLIFIVTQLSEKLGVERVKSINDFSHAWIFAQMVDQT